MDALNRRNTKFPGNLASSPNRKRRADTEIDTSEKRRTGAAPFRLSASAIPRPPQLLETSTRVRPPAALPVKANAHSQQFSPNPRFKTKETQALVKRDFVHKCDPWQENEYRRIFKCGDGKIIAHKQEITHAIVAVKEHSYKNDENIKNLAGCIHENVIQIKEAYVDQGKIFFMYEFTDVTLSEIQATPYGEFTPYQIAAICQKVA